MERAMTQQKRNSNILREVQLLIELKIKNIENKTNRVIRSYTEKGSISLNAENHLMNALPVFSKTKEINERVINYIENYSIAVGRLLHIRSMLQVDNVMGIIDLLSNDKFLLCSESTIDRALRVEAPKVALQVA